MFLTLLWFTYVLCLLCIREILVLNSLSYVLFSPSPTRSHSGCVSDIFEIKNSASRRVSITLAFRTTAQGMWSEITAVNYGNARTERPHVSPAEIPLSQTCPVYLHVFEQLVCFSVPGIILLVISGIS